MSTYPFDELMSKWSRGDITTEQAIGHMLQHINKLYEQIRELKQRLPKSVDKQ